MLLTMAVYDTPENNRSALTLRTLASLRKTVDWNKHRLIVSDNGSCVATHCHYKRFADIIETVIYNGENLGTAKALNRAWKHRHIGEHVCKVDNDVVWHLPGWADAIVSVFQKAPKVGICGLKRVDLDEWPTEEGFYKTQLAVVPHVKGEPWLIIELSNHVIGTCQAYSSACLDAIGYLWQPGLYGFDDALACARAKIAGFHNAFLHGYPIDHIDPGGDAFCQWKQDHAGQTIDIYFEALKKYQSGEWDVYYDGSFDFIKV